VGPAVVTDGCPAVLPGPHHRPRCAGDLVWFHRIER